MKTVVYAAYLKNEEQLRKSSSGGMFTALSDVALRCGDAIICTIYNYKKNICEFKLLTTAEELDEARGSKYMQSYPNDIFNEARKWLLENPAKKLMFFGTGCQAAGFLNYIEIHNMRSRVLVVDLICHGVPSPAFWKQYITALKDKYAGELRAFSFKDKRNRWEHPTSVAYFGDKEVSIQQFRNMYSRRHLIRPSCYECHYCKTDRGTDLTIGDFWHIDERLGDFYNPMGNSVVLVHTEVGKNVFNRCTEYLEYQECSVEQCMQPNLKNPTARPEMRNLFWKEYKTKGLDYVNQKYGVKNMFNRARIKLDKIFGGGYKLTPAYLCGGQQYASICC